MKFSFSLAFAISVAESVSAHYIWTTLNYGTLRSGTPVRVPLNNTPVQDVTSNYIRCNVNPTPATATVNVAAGSLIGFDLDNTVYHLGPAAIYLGQAPGNNAAAWDGSGANWFKIAEWGAVFSPSFSFADFGATVLNTTIPTDTPSGQYLVRIEQIGLHVVGAPQWYISCGQINIQNGGSGNPSKVSIPGYVQPNDPGLTVDIYDPVPTAYTVPGPPVWRGGGSGSPVPPTTTTKPTTTTPPTTTVKPTSTTTTSSAAGATLTQYAQCGGQGWTGTGTCAPPAKCSAVSPPYYSQCL